MYTSQQILNWCKKYIGPSFIGVYSRNTLPNFNHKNLPISLIVNTDSNNLPGVHWIAIIIHRNHFAEVFDSFGNFPNSFFVNWLNFNCLGWTYNKYIVQNPFSLSCGLFCMYFLYQRSHMHILNFNNFIIHVFNIINYVENEQHINNFFKNTIM